MKSSRLVDVLDTEDGLEFWNKMCAKMNILLIQMKSKKGNYDIDDPEIRCVSDRKSSIKRPISHFIYFICYINNAIIRITRSN